MPVDLVVTTAAELAATRRRDPSWRDAVARSLPLATAADG